MLVAGDRQWLSLTVQRYAMDAGSCWPDRPDFRHPDSLSCCHPFKARAMPWGYCEEEFIVFSAGKRERDGALSCGFRVGRAGG